MSVRCADGDSNCYRVGRQDSRDRNWVRNSLIDFLSHGVIEPHPILANVIGCKAGRVVAMRKIL